MRDYPKEPDWTHISGQYEDHQRRLGRLAECIDRPGFVDDPSWIGRFVQAGGWAVGYGWALERPVDELREVLRPAIGGLHAGLAAGIRPDARRTTYPLQVAVIAGDRDGARGVARLRRAIPVEDPPNDTVSHVDLMLAAFALDDPDTAREHADIITTQLDRLETPPDIVEAVTGLDRMARAILDGDQAELQDAATDRAATIAGAFGGSIEARRNINGIFDFAGVALCRFAHATGLDLPDQPIYAADLIRDL